MGTVVSIDLRGGGDHAAAVAALVAWFHEVDHRFSTYREDSEVSRVGRGELRPADRSADLAEVLAACDRVRDLSGGRFDAWRGGRLDPSAYVKGWSVDRAVGLLDAHGCRDWMLNAGGDVRTHGAPQPGLPWRVGVQHPRRRDAVAAVLALRDGAVATSGEYERGHHIIDPHTGSHPEGVLSVTIVGWNLALADAYATAAFAMGDRVAHHWVARLRGYAGMVILRDGRVLSTPSLRCAA